MHILPQLLLQSYHKSENTTLFWKSHVPPYITHQEMWESIWPLPLTAILISLILFISAKKHEKKKGLFFVLLAFSMLGLATGYLTGFSRESAVGAVLPSVLSLFGGLSIFLIGKNQESRIITSLAVLSFAICLVLGTSWGAIMRQSWEDHKLSKEYFQKQALIEVEVNEFRESLGLKPIKNCKD